MRKPIVHEVLATLYLRLNGYFTTGLILHSDIHGRNRTDIDCLAIRHPHHEQLDRIIETDAFLDPSKELTDLIICEVKSDPSSLGFNKPIQNEIEILRNTLRWAGIFTKRQANSVADRLQPLFRDGVPMKMAREGVNEAGCRVRPLLCCPPCPEPVHDRWCVTKAEIFDFADRCFNPAEPRPSSSVRYNFQQWGYPFTSIVQYLKDSKNSRSLEGLYEHLKAE